VKEKETQGKEGEGKEEEEKCIKSKEKQC